MKLRAKNFIKCILAFPFCWSYMLAQELHVGNICPDVQLNHIINYGDSAAALYHFTNRLLILDFWGTGCIGCIQSFSHLNQLRKKFGDSIQIIMVNSETEDSTKKFFSRHSKIQVPAFPFVTQDTELKKYFPHVYVPHQVWLNVKKQVVAITGGYNLTDEHIEEFLKRNKIELAIKADINPTVSGLPVILAPDSSKIISNALYYSGIMPSLGSTGVNYQRDAVGGSIKTNRIIMNNASVLRLLQVAFGEEGKYDFNPRNTVILNVKDTFRYVYPSDNNLYDEWSSGNSFFYELKVPGEKANNFYKFMQQDLERFFNVTARVEQKKIECYLLVKTGKIIKLDSTPGAFKVKYLDTGAGTIAQFQNMPFSQFVWNLKSSFSGMSVKQPVIDATGLNGSLAISYTSQDLFDDMNQQINMEGCKQLLRKYNLDLIKKEWLTYVLIIQENNK